MHRWWLVVPDAAMVRPGELPEGWGLMALAGGRLRAATRAPLRQPRPLPPERLAAFATDLRATARRHPSVFPLLLERPAATAAARQARDEISLALADAGIPQQDTDQMQRLLSTAILGFALSEVAGRFDAQTAPQRDADFELLLEILTESIQSRLRA